LEFVAEYGRRLMADKKQELTPEIISVINRFNENYERVKDLTTPTQKPIYEMTLAEFERLMNI